MRNRIVIGIVICAMVLATGCAGKGQAKPSEESTYALTTEAQSSEPASTSTEYTFDMLKNEFEKALEEEQKKYDDAGTSVSENSVSENSISGN